MEELKKEIQSNFKIPNIKVKRLEFKERDDRDLSEFNFAVHVYVTVLHNMKGVLLEGNPRYPILIGYSDGVLQEEPK